MSSRRLRRIMTFKIAWEIIRTIQFGKNSHSTKWSWFLLIWEKVDPIFSLQKPIKTFITKMTHKTFFRDFGHLFRPYIWLNAKSTLFLTWGRKCNWEMLRGPRNGIVIFLMAGAISSGIPAVCWLLINKLLFLKAQLFSKLTFLSCGYLVNQQTIS